MGSSSLVTLCRATRDDPTGAQDLFNIGTSVSRTVSLVNGSAFLLRLQVNAQASAARAMDCRPPYQRRRGPIESSSARESKLR